VRDGSGLRPEAVMDAIGSALEDRANKLAASPAVVEALGAIGIN